MPGGIQALSMTVRIVSASSFMSRGFMMNKK
jgi:hypothetical protein